MKIIEILDMEIIEIKDDNGQVVLKGKPITFHDARNQCIDGLKDTLQDYVNLDYCYKGVKIIDGYNQNKDDDGRNLALLIDDYTLELVVWDEQHNKIIDWEYLIYEAHE